MKVSTTLAILALGGGGGSATAFITASSPRAAGSRSSSLMRRFVLTEPETISVVNGEAAPVAKVEESPVPPVTTKTDESVAVASQPEPPAAKKEPAELFFVEEVDPKAQIEPGRYAGIDYSITLPFFQRPPKLDGSHAGDYGFDPCGFTEEYDIYYMQECELRHARLAMLAVVGWPISELIAPDFMLQDGRAPSVLNGFNPISGGAVLAAFAAIGALEYATSLRRTCDTKLGMTHQKDMEKIWKYGVAGDYNFDPLGLYSMLGDDAYGRKAMRELEICHGRWAMMGITGFAFLEALSGKPIVENNILFHPNPVVPLLAVSYLVWSQFFQISDVREYPIKVKYTKDGEEMLRSIQRSLNAQQ